MSDNEGLRAGDAERESALSALGEHLSAGRLDVDEYGDRSARVAAARTWGELLALFTDLPEPRPRLSTQVGPAAPATPSSLAAPVGGQIAEQHPQLSVGHRLVGAAVPLASIIAVLLYFTVLHRWEIFLIIPAVAVLGGALAGGPRGWHGSHDHRDHRGRRR